MALSDEKTRYRKGDNPEPDRKFALFKKVNLFVGAAYHNALSSKEADTLIKIWTKARMVPKRLDVNEVLILVEFTEVILAWRENRRKELSRIRKERARRKLKDAAMKGSREALIKVESIKKADKLKSAKYRRKKRKLGDKTSKSDVCRG